MLLVPENIIEILIKNEKIFHPPLQGLSKIGKPIKSGHRNRLTQTTQLWNEKPKYWEKYGVADWSLDLAMERNKPKGFLLLLLLKSNLEYIHV